MDDEIDIPRLGPPRGIAQFDQRVAMRVFTALDISEAAGGVTYDVLDDLCPGLAHSTAR